MQEHVPRSPQSASESTRRLSPQITDRKRSRMKGAPSVSVRRSCILFKNETPKNATWGQRYGLELHNST